MQGKDPKAQSQHLPSSHSAGAIARLAPRHRPLTDVCNPHGHVNVHTYVLLTCPPTFTIVCIWEGSPVTNRNFWRCTFICYPLHYRGYTIITPQYLRLPCSSSLPCYASPLFQIAHRRAMSCFFFRQVSVSYSARAVQASRDIPDARLSSVLIIEPARESSTATSSSL